MTIVQPLCGGDGRKSEGRKEGFRGRERERERNLVSSHSGCSPMWTGSRGRERRRKRGKDERSERRTNLPAPHADGTVKTEGKVLVTSRMKSVRYRARNPH
jgi:hypothetical protein